MATRERAQGRFDDDQDPTLRLDGRRIQANPGLPERDKQREDLFLNLARAESMTDDASDRMSRVERRRVGTY